MVQLNIHQSMYNDQAPTWKAKSVVKHIISIWELTLLKEIFFLTINTEIME